MRRIIVAIRWFLNDRFNLSHEKDDNLATILSIEKGVEFRGVNLWTLIFAIFIASIGLNVNSTAVIIGAMLISPLMGPIMGLGLSIGIYDFALLKRSLKNLSIAVIISVMTSAAYFFISPLDEAQSELLARTTPTIYDVLIALFGGLAGIVAGATKEKGNVIPGVAIATALMPPLCTAGFGIATGNIYYFLGAFYLFFINTVMISLSTFLIVRFLKFPLKQIVDEAQSHTVRRYIYIIVTATVLPSIYFAYRIIRETIFINNANNFITNELAFDRTQVIDRKIKFNQFDTSSITVFLVGENLDQNQVNALVGKLPDYSLGKTTLNVRQGVEDAAKLDLNQIRSGIIEEIYHKNELALADKDKKIAVLEKEIIALKSNGYPVQAIAAEIQAINPKVRAFSVNRIIYYDATKTNPDTTLTANIVLKSPLRAAENKTLNNWLNKRLGNNNLRVIVE